MILCRGGACRLVVVGEVAQEEEGKHVVAEVVRIHGPAQLVGDAPEGVAQLFSIGIGHAGRKQGGLIGKLWCDVDYSAHGGVVEQIFGL